MDGVASLMMDDEPYYTAAMSAYPDSRVLRRKFMIMSRFGDEVLLYNVREEDGESRILVPRAVCPLGKDRRSVGDEINFKFSALPRNGEQARVMSETANLLSEGKSFIVEAGTGFGKTVCALSAAAAVGRRTLVVCTKEDVVTQWREAAKRFMGLNTRNVGLIQQDACSARDKPLTLGMIHSLAKPGRYPSWVYDYFGLVIVDEVHRLAAETFSRVACLFNSKLRLGLSATADRVDGKDFVFKAHIGPVMIRAAMPPMVPRVLVYETGWRLPRWKTRGGLVQMRHEAGKLGGVVKYMVRSPERNALVGRLLTTAWKRDRRTVFFSDSLEHLDKVRAVTTALGVPGTDIGYYIGGMSAAERDRSAGKKIILATYRMMGEATDIPWLDCCVLGTPRSDARQSVGRILREYPDKKTPVVMDLVDGDSRILANYAMKRLRWYRSLGARVERMN